MGDRSFPLACEMRRKFAMSSPEHGRESKKEPHKSDDSNRRMVDKQGALFTAVDYPHRNGRHEAEQCYGDDRRNGPNKNAFYIDHHDPLSRSFNPRFQGILSG